jgi:DNA-binding FrmR family transcriptional regulator
MVKTYGYAENKEQILKRLSRAEGQVRGVAGMVQDDTYCIDILTQVAAVQSALDKVALELVRDHAKHCMADDNPKKRDEKADELMKAIGRLLSK